MKRWTLGVAALGLAAAVALAQKKQKERVPVYEPPEVVSAADPIYPYNSIAQGSVILQLSIGATGELDGVQVLRDVPSLTVEAEKAVKKWRFKPATLDGRPVRSTMAVSFTFRTITPPPFK
jgi:protein TonB